MAVNQINNSESYPTLSQSIFIHNFQAGASESSAIGYGAMVGFDAYTKKGAVLLAKKNTAFVQFTLGEYPTYVDISTSSSGVVGGRLWVQTNLANVYYSDNYTTGSPTLTQVVVTSPPVGEGQGLIVFQGDTTTNPFVFIFYERQIWYAQANGATPAFSVFSTTGSVGLNASYPNSPINANHFPFVFPNNQGFYFCNGNQIGFIGVIFPVGATSPTPFNPGGTINTDYKYSQNILTLPANYVSNTLSFLPPSNLAIGAAQVQSNNESGLFTWDTISQNKFNFLSMFSVSNLANGVISGGVKQLINRNNVLYAAMSGNHAVYSTNGSSFGLVMDTSLYSTVRDINGKEYSNPVFFNSFPQAIGVYGNRVITGNASSTNTSYYNSNNIGVFPIAVWSIAFNADGSTLQQCEYIVPLNSNIAGSIVSTPGNGDYAAISCLKTLPNGQIAIGTSVKSGGGNTVGQVNFIDPYSYIQNISSTSLESELYEIGTPLVPTTISNIEINLIKDLLTGQTIDISYRTSTDQDYTVIDTFTGDGTTNQYKLTQNPIGACQYLQVRVRAATTATYPNDTPELRTVIIT